MKRSSTQPVCVTLPRSLVTKSKRLAKRLHGKRGFSKFLRVTLEKRVAAAK